MVVRLGTAFLFLAPLLKLNYQIQIYNLLFVTQMQGAVSAHRFYNIHQDRLLPVDLLNTMHLIRYTCFRNREVSNADSF